MCVFCEVDVSELEEMGPVIGRHDTQTTSKGGHPITEVVETHGPDSASTIEVEISSATDTDVEHMMDFPRSDPVLPETAGVAKTCMCPVCNTEIYSGLALQCHMHMEHKGIKPYKCDQCNSSFNNLKEISNHKSVVHRVASISCKFCNYHCRPTMKARMWQHSWVHSKGLKCNHCPKMFLSVASLCKHTTKHSEREKIECDTCDGVFISSASYATHRKGVHGDGYICLRCGERFKSPVQRVRHLKKCVK